jgi:hypothetical protein
MSKVNKPLLGIGATGSIGDQITYQKTPGGHKAYIYTQPGARTPTPPTPSQLTQRGIVGAAIIDWQAMTPTEKAIWNARATAERYHGTGYHLFLHETLTVRPSFCILTEDAKYLLLETNDRINQEN